jgi:hypothetical protein
MLVLSRNKQESVVVGDTNCFECIIKITVLEIIGGKVKLGFEADEGVVKPRGCSARRYTKAGLASDLRQKTWRANRRIAGLAGTCGDACHDPKVVGGSGREERPERLQPRAWRQGEHQ